LFLSFLLGVLFASHVLGVYRDGGFCHEPIMLHCLFARNRCSDQQHQDGRTFVAPQCDFGVLHFALKRLAQVVAQAFYVVLTTLHIEVLFFLLRRLQEHA